MHRNGKIDRILYRLHKLIGVLRREYARHVLYAYRRSAHALKLTHKLNVLVERMHGACGVRYGGGSLGSALIQDSGLMQFGLHIVAGFDVDEKVVGTEICGIPIYHISELPERERQYKAEIGILAVPVEHAQESADLLVANGLRAIWNFTPFRIKVADNVVIQNTSIYAHLAVMYNRINGNK